MAAFIKCQISPVFEVNKNQNQRESEEAKVNGGVKKSFEKPILGVSRARKLQRYSSRGACLAIRSFKMDEVQ